MQSDLVFPRIDRLWQTGRRKAVDKTVVATDQTSTQQSRICVRRTASCTSTAWSRRRLFEGDTAASWIRRSVPSDWSESGRRRRSVAHRWSGWYGAAGGRWTRVSGWYTRSDRCTVTQTHIYTEQPFTTLSNQRCTVVARIYSGSFGPVRSLVGILH